MDDPRGRHEQQEDHLIAEIERVLREKLEHDYPPGSTKRDAHPKHTALLRATFTVAADVPPALRVGVFAEPRSYEAWVRLSNASGTPQSDAKKDFRGFAIKLTDVPGAKIPESDEETTQDFVLLSNPTVPFGTVKMFRDAIVYSIKRSILLFALKLILTGQRRVLRDLARGRVCPRSPLAWRYFSTTPYQLGAETVKYSLIPGDGVDQRAPENPGDNYLGEAVAERLARGAVSFDFAVQLRKPEMPVDDASVLWDEAASPFIKVGTLNIPPQDFRNEARAALAERLSFSPAHALPAHRPLGGVNRARMRIYRALASFRQSRNGVQRLTV